MVALKIEEVTKGFSMCYWTEPVYNRIVHMDLDMPLLARRQVKPSTGKNAASRFSKTKLKGC